MRYKRAHSSSFTSAFLFLFIFIFIFNSVLSAFIASSAAWADSESGSAESPSANESPGNPEAKTDSTSDEPKEKSGDNRTVLQGGVRGAAIRMEEGLVLIESSARMVQAPALEMAKECTRKETAVMRGPNYIGNGIVIPAIGNPTSTVQIGELPARKDKLESFLSGSEQAMKALRSHVDGLIVPEGDERLANLWKGMQSTMQAAEKNIISMRALIEQTSAKRGEIKQKDAKPFGQAALKVYDSMTALEKIRTQMDEILKPEINGSEAKSKE